MSLAAPARRVHISAAAFAEGAAEKLASPEGATGVSAGGGAMSEGFDRPEVPGMKEWTVHKTNTAPTSDPMPPGLNAFTVV